MISAMREAPRDNAGNTLSRHRKTTEPSGVSQEIEESRKLMSLPGLYSLLPDGSPVQGSLPELKSLKSLRRIAKVPRNSTKFCTAPA